MVLHSKAAREKIRRFEMPEFSNYEGVASKAAQSLVSITFKMLRKNGCVIFLGVYAIVMFCVFFWMILERQLTKLDHYELELYQQNVHQKNGRTWTPKPDYCLYEQHSRKVPTFFKFNGDLHVLAAYKDDRSSDGTVIRTFGLSRTKPQGYCLVDNVDDGSKKAVPMTVKYLSEDDQGKEFRAVSITCQLQETLSENPCYVFLSQTTRIKLPYLKLPLHVMYQADTQYSYTVCSAILAGPLPQTTLVEFIEFHKILGADNFHLYQYQGDSLNIENNMNTASVIRHYEEYNKVKVAHWKLPVPSSSVHQHALSLARQHCLYQNMWTSEFVFAPGLYQYLIPKDTTNWFNMLRPLTKPKGTKFCFQTFYFPPVGGELLLTMSSLNRSFKPNAKMLCLIPPTKADLIEDHPNIRKGNNSYLQVDIQKGFVHDYRHLDKTNIDNSVYAPDISATKFKYELQIAFKRTMKLIFDDQIEKFLDSK